MQQQASGRGLGPIKLFAFPLEYERASKPLKPPTKTEMEIRKKLPMALVLLTTEIGAEKHVLNSLKKISGVQEAHPLWGVYDIIANVQAPDMEALKTIITSNINKIGKVNSKLTMIIEDRAPQVEPQLIFEQPIYA
jgi:DNA-binding Lrp family transcriptional regulator